MVQAVATVEAQTETESGSEESKNNEYLIILAKVARRAKALGPRVFFGEEECEVIQSLIPDAQSMTPCQDAQVELLARLAIAGQ